MIITLMVISPVGTAVKIFKQAQDRRVSPFTTKIGSLRLIASVLSHILACSFCQTQDCLHLYRLFSAGSAIVSLHVNG